MAIKKDKKVSTTKVVAGGGKVVVSGKKTSPYRGKITTLGQAVYGHLEAASAGTIKTAATYNDIEIGNTSTEKGKRFLKVAKMWKQLSSVSFDWNDDSRGLDLVSLIRLGIDYKTFDALSERVPLSDNDWATILETTTRTLDRYKKDNKRFASKQSETIIEIQQLMQYGEEVFGDIENFNSWLLMVNVALGGVAPKELLDTSIGLGMVKDMLGRIEHGILA